MASRRILRRSLPTSSRSRHYHSYETPQQAPYPPLETSILSAALSHVPTHGFTQTSLRAGARDTGYLDATTNLFPRAAFELVLYHLRTQRSNLSANTPSETKSTGANVRALVLARLRGNVEARTVRAWTGALGLMSLAGNIPASVNELALLSDEIWFLAGDEAVDSSWYTKRASLAAVYAATEVFQTTDQSSDGRDTEAFLDRRLEDVRGLGSAWRNVGLWAGFQGVAAVNLARSLGARI